MTTLEQVVFMLAEQQKRQLDLLEKLTTQKTATTSSNEAVMDTLAKCINEFRYDPDSNQTFQMWYARYKDLFEIDAEQLDGAAKVRLLLRKLNIISHDKYIDYILPKQPKEFTFEETLTTLEKMFGRQQSIFNTRYTCLQTSKKDTDDFVSYAAIVNRQCENFELSKLTADQFKCLVFVTGIQSPRDSEIRSKLLTLLNAEPKASPVNLDNLISEVYRIINLRKDTSLIECKGNQSTSFSQVQSIQAHNQKTNKYKQAGQSNINKSKNHSHSSTDVPRTPCWNCGEMHYVKYCTYSNKQCNQCGNIGHKQGYCNSASKAKSNSKAQQSNFKAKQSSKSDKTKSRSDVKAIHVHQINFTNQRRHLSVQINNRKIILQLDTGSDISIISRQVWQKIGSPTISQTYHCAKDANGNKIKFIGECKVNIQIKGQNQSGTLFISNVTNLNIFGTDLLEKFNL